MLQTPSLDPLLRVSTSVHNVWRAIGGQVLQVSLNIKPLTLTRKHHHLPILSHDICAGDFQVATWLGVGDLGKT